jgi:hypothetical protein
MEWTTSDLIYHQNNVPEPNSQGKRSRVSLNFSQMSHRQNPLQINVANISSGSTIEADAPNDDIAWLNVAENDELAQGVTVCVE